MTIMMDAIRKLVRKFTSFKGIILIYAAVFVLSLIYFVSLQGFGFRGLQFTIAGRDGIISFFDIALLILTILSLFLLAISLVAFRRRRDVRIFLVSVAFFFFAVKQFLGIFDNFFPEENIFIGNAASVLELLILTSFVLLMLKR